MGQHKETLTHVEQAERLTGSGFSASDIASAKHLCDRGLHKLAGSMVGSTSFVIASIAGHSFKRMAANNQYHAFNGADVMGEQMLVVADLLAEYEANIEAMAILAQDDDLEAIKVAIANCYRLKLNAQSVHRHMFDEDFECSKLRHAALIDSAHDAALEALDSGKLEPFAALEECFTYFDYVCNGADECMCGAHYDSECGCGNWVD